MLNFESMSPKSVPDLAVNCDDAIGEHWSGQKACLPVQASPGLVRHGNWMRGIH